MWNLPLLTRIYLDRTSHARNLKSLSASKQRPVKPIDTKSSKSCVVLSRTSKHFSNTNTCCRKHEPLQRNHSQIENTRSDPSPKHDVLDGLKVEKQNQMKSKTLKFLPNRLLSSGFVEGSTGQGRTTDPGESREKEGRGADGKIEREKRDEKGADVMGWRRKRKKGEGRERTLGTSKGERREDERTITIMHVLVSYCQNVKFQFANFFSFAWNIHIDDSRNLWICMYQSFNRDISVHPFSNIAVIIFTSFSRKIKWHLHKWLEMKRYLWKQFRLHFTSSF